MKCAECKAHFEYDDKIERVFVDLVDPRLPVSGTVCATCGLLQSEENKMCEYCEEDMCGTL